MDTTKLIVEYLIIGMLVVLSIIFLAFSISPQMFTPIWSFLNPNESPVGTTAFIIILLPIAYGIGIVAEFLGMLLLEWRFNIVKEKRFPPFFEQNQKWLLKEELFKDLIKKDNIIQKGTGLKLYGDMRFFTLMNNSCLYAEIERQLNQVRILRSFVIAEIIFAISFAIQLIAGSNLVFALIGLATMLLLIISNIGAVNYRFDHYCRSIERSYKALKLEKSKKPIEK
jgi:hypothetical protein